MARKSGNTSVFQVDKTSFFWAMKCGSCHPGAGPAEFSRDKDPNDPTGQAYLPYYDESTGQFGYEVLGKSASDVYSEFDGDYTFLHPMFMKYMNAPWNATGVSQADCLICHMEGYSWFNRTVTLGAGPNLFMVTGYKAFQSAPAAGAGWATINMNAVVMMPGQLPYLNPQAASDFAIDYDLGINSGTLSYDDPNNPSYYVIPAEVIVKETPDQNCWNCHGTPDVRKYGRSWESDTDAHNARGVFCVNCHPAGEDAPDPKIQGHEKHDFAKGTSMIGSVRDDLDGTMFDCEDCHVKGAYPGAPDPATAHAQIPSFHFGKIACESCHIPYKEDSVITPTKEDPDLVIDMSFNGNQVIYPWSSFFDNDPVDPTAHDSSAPSSRWYPSLVLFKGKIAPAKPLLTIWWGEWNGKTDPDEIVVQPYPLWQVRLALQTDPTTGMPQNPVVQGALTNDSNALAADGSDPYEVNTTAEIAAYIYALKTATIQVTDGGPDGSGTTPITKTGLGSNPVLVKGCRIFYLADDGGTPDDPSDDTIASFESELAEPHNFSIHHNVQPSYRALGAGGCEDCHRVGSPFFERKMLICPWDENGNPVYESAYEEVGYSEGELEELTESVPEEESPSLGSSECFIATAAFGSPLEKHVKVLREFRERYLLTNPVGTLVVKAYYALSPPVARFIARHETLRAAVRLALYPVVGIAWASLYHPGATALVLFGIGAAAIVVVRRKRSVS
ncbi:MAG: hypothetical protein D6713_06440 [Deltaproteobacteria bacterium]|nr:MAG: hypothetical protein D6713_06440 [Deltaproteobacteria bacterium]